MREPAIAPRLADLFLPAFTRLAAIQPGERVLDLCSADGETLLAAARRSGEQGEQLALDDDAGRLDALLARARAEGLSTLHGALWDGTALPGPAAYWDVVLCHLGLPHLADPERTLREVHRVLRPVGRVAITVFGQRDRCPLLTIFLEAVAPLNPATKALDRATFRYSATGTLAAALAAAGFEDAVPERLTEWPAFADVDEYWSALSADSRLAPLVAGLDGEQIAAAKAAIEARTKLYRRRGGIELKVEGVVIAAVK